MCLVGEIENRKENNFSPVLLFGEDRVFFPNWEENGRKTENYSSATVLANTLVFFSFLLNFFYKV